MNIIEILILAFLVLLVLVISICVGLSWYQNRYLRRMDALADNIEILFRRVSELDDKCYELRNLLQPDLSQQLHTRLVDLDNLDVKIKHNAAQISELKTSTTICLQSLQTLQNHFVDK